jgi:hypothetical protein
MGGVCATCGWAGLWEEAVREPSARTATDKNAKRRMKGFSAKDFSKEYYPVECDQAMRYRRGGAVEEGRRSGEQTVNLLA